MTRTKKRPPPNANNLNVSVKAGEDKALLIARLILRPSVSNGMALTKLLRVDTQDAEGLQLAALVDALKEQCDLTIGGDLGRGEAMLTVQAHTLDAAFTHLVERAALNFGEYIGAAETYMRLALKAQGQCGATWEAIAEMKNPRAVAFVRQANIAA